MFLLVKTHVFAYFFCWLKNNVFVVFLVVCCWLPQLVYPKNHPGETVASRKILTPGTPQRGWAPVWDI
jgi:hypothetical protein